MDNLVWLLPLLICPFGMLLVGAVVWVAVKLGLRSSEPGEDPPEDRKGAMAHDPSRAAPNRLERT